MRHGAIRPWLLAGAMTLLTGCAYTRLTPDIPHLEKRDGMTKLIVDGRPFICVAGELANSSSSDREATKTTIPRLAKANLNTILTVVSWDLIEPKEGKFDFSMVDYQIEAARAANVRLIFLWMASWKNGLSHYPPAWVKADQERFPRVVNAQGKTLEILSTFSQANRDADASAFAAVMRHIREVDKQHTVIAIQVENEVGVLGSTRDFCPTANAEFAQKVPAELMAYLQDHKENLLPEFRKIWSAAGEKTSGTWEEVFGKNVSRPDAPVPNSRGRQPRAAAAELFNHTDEIFMAWHYAKYMGHVAAQGKKEYPIPMYANAWIVQPNDLGAGDYPSGGPEVLVHDVWRAGAPAIDILAPDIYLPQYAQVLQSFARNGNPAFNPETRQDSNTCWNAFTQLNALCYSPFGIDNLQPDSAFARTYGLVNALSGALAEAQGKKDAIKVITPAAGQNPGRVEMGDYVFDFTAAPGGRGGAGGATATAPADPVAATGPAPGVLPNLDVPYLIIIQTEPDLYYFATNGSYPFRVSTTIPGANIAAPAGIDRGYFKNGQWVMVHRYNGDDLMGLGYDLSAAAANNQAGTRIPLGLARGRGPAPASATAPASGEAWPVPTVFRVRFYHYR